MKISQLKEIEPKAEVYELREDARYLIVVRESASPEALERFAKYLHASGLDNFAIAVGGVDIFEFQSAPQN
jgi:hypothetical protein